MRYRSIAAAGFAVLATLTSLLASFPATAQTPGLVAVYAFNEGAGTTVTDVSGNNNTGTIGTATWSSAGKFGNALVFNGTNALVTIPNAASLQLTTGMTLEAWVNLATVTARWRDLIYEGGDSYYLEATSTNASLPGAGATLGNAFGTAALAANTWTHLATTFDGATLRLYVNGVQASSRAVTGTLPTSTNPLQIGGDSLFGKFFRGMIDEVRIYNRALTQAEIQADMATPVGGTPPPPDTTPPIAPTALGATAASATQINLSWTASTDNVAVTGYRVERCQGAGCTTFAQIATPTVTILNDTGLTASTSYSYRVRATDAAGNLSAYSSVASATTSSTPLGLMAAYAFNEGAGTTVADVSGNNNTGTIGTATWSSAGKFGNALVFNGTNALVTIPNAASLQLTTGMTLEAWVNLATVTAQWRDVIYKGDDNYYLEATSTNASLPGAGATLGNTFGTAALAANTWTHLATTFDGATLRLYVNGVQASSRAMTGTLPTSTNPLQIGGDSLFGQFFQGRIDEVRIYNRALTQAEIQADMATPVGGTPPPPDTTPPVVNLTSPAPGATVFNQVSVSAVASDNVGIAGVQFLLDSVALVAEVT